MTRRYRWIADEIAALDPETDYETIWRLTSCYGIDDFSLNLVYAHLFPHFYLPHHGAQTLWGTQKVVEKATQRVEDTIRNNVIWWFHGPSHPRTRDSVESINKLHAHIATQHPGAFEDQDDFLFTLAFSAASLHRFNLALGLPGYTDKQKIAAHHFWRDMADLFTDEHGAPIANFPPDWDSMIELVESYEQRSWTYSPFGALVTHAVLDQFAHRYWPRPLHGLARALVLSTLHPSCWRTYRIDPPRPWVRRMLLTVVGVGLRVQRAVTPDPRTSYLEELDALDRTERFERRREIRAVDEDFAQFFTSRHRELLRTTL
ncbi:hypothetical protein HX744_19640 [Pseudonocardia sp. ICBG1122]|nr:hypothetical protein [Pseudonocardia pini]